MYPLFHILDICIVDLVLIRCISTVYKFFLYPLCDLKATTFKAASWSSAFDINHITCFIMTGWLKQTWEYPEWHSSLLCLQSERCWESSEWKVHRYSEQPAAPQPLPAHTTLSATSGATDALIWKASIHTIMWESIAMLYFQMFCHFPRQLFGTCKKFPTSHCQHIRMKSEIPAWCWTDWGRTRWGIQTFQTQNRNRCQAGKQQDMDLGSGLSSLDTWHGWIHP